MCSVTVFTPCNLKPLVVVQMSLKEWLTLGLEDASEVKLHQLKSAAGVNAVSWCTVYSTSVAGRGKKDCTALDSERREMAHCCAKLSAAILDALGGHRRTRKHW